VQRYALHWYTGPALLATAAVFIAWFFAVFMVPVRQG